MHVWETVCHRHGLKKIMLGKQLKVSLAGIGYQQINVKLKSASATKSDSQGHLKRRRHISNYSNWLFLLKSCLPSLPFFQAKEPMGGHTPPLPTLRPTLFIFSTRKFIFGVLLPPSLHCSFFSSTPFPCSRLVAPFWILLGPKYLFLLQQTIHLLESG